MKKTLTWLVCCLLCNPIWSQNDSPSESTNEIINLVELNQGATVVVSIVALTIVGFFLFLFVTERKVTRLEKNLKEKN